MEELPPDAARTRALQTGSPTAPVNSSAVDDAHSTPQSQDTAFLTQWLADRNTPCPNCRYALRGLQAPRCPECGEALTMRVGLESPRAGALITGVAGLASGLGFHTLVLIWGLTSGASQRELTPLLLGVLIGGMLLPLWLRSAPRLRAFGSALRWSLALLCFVPGVLFFMLFVSRV